MRLLGLVSAFLGYVGWVLGWWVWIWDLVVSWVLVVIVAMVVGGGRCLMWFGGYFDGVSYG